MHVRKSRIRQVGWIAEGARIGPDKNQDASVTHNEHQHGYCVIHDENTDSVHRAFFVARPFLVWITHPV